MVHFVMNVTMTIKENNTMIYKYAPTQAMSLDHGMIQVIKWQSFPPFNHPMDSPIKDDYTLLVLTLSDNSKRFWGCQDAYINSELKMVVVFGDDLTDEVILKSWKTVHPENYY